MQFIIRKPWDLPQRDVTPEHVWQHRQQHRREFLQSIARGAAGAGLLGVLPGCGRPTEEQLQAAAGIGWLPGEFSDLFPATRSTQYEYGRSETDQRAAAEYANFYEFTSSKSVYQYVDAFDPWPWTVEVGGLCSRPRTFDMSDILREFPVEERRYRHRCVETWAMCVPWTGFPLRDLLQAVETQPSARYVLFETFNRPDQAPQMSDETYPWPYTEGLTLAEATNQLTLLATGIYGTPLPRQHGPPIRLVVPWKYGYKSIKSIVKITLVAEQPPTFWNTLIPQEYGFQANVDPDVSHPRWSQQSEWMLGSQERFPTQQYNGYGDQVGSLYV